MNLVTNAYNDLTLGFVQLSHEFPSKTHQLVKAFFDFWGISKGYTFVTAEQ